MVAAKEAMAKGDLAAAKVELKTALQDDPDSVDVRLMLAQALYREGDYTNALVELDKAEKLTAAPTKVTPLVARAMLASGAYKKITDQFSAVKLNDAEAQGDLSAAVAEAWAMQGDAGKARGLVDDALKTAPANAALLLAKARLIASAGQLDEALGMVDGLTKAGNARGEPWLLAGDLQLYGKHDPAKAVEAYREALNIDPVLLRAHSGLISTLLATRRYDEAQKAFDQLRKAFPAHFQTMYFSPQLAAVRGDYKTARDQFAHLVQMAPDNVLLLSLAGTNEMTLGANVQAETYLTRAVKLAPKLSAPRLKLAQVLLRTNKPAQALETVQPLLDGDKVEASVLQTAATAQLQLGNAAAADVLLARAAKIAPDSVELKTALAMRQLGKGDEKGALDALTAIAGNDKGDTADYALINLHLQRRQFDQALKAVDALAAKEPKQPAVADFKGRILLAKGDKAGARAAFGQALALSAAFFPSAAVLAEMDMADKKPAEALARLEAVAKADVKNVDALMAIGAWHARQNGTVEEVSDAYKKAIAVSRTERTPRLALMAYLVDKRKFSEALAIAQEGVAAMPGDARMLEALGSAQAASGDAQQAISTYLKVVKLRPESIPDHLRLAELYAARNEASSATAALKQVLALDASNVPAQQALIRLAAQTGKYDAAQAIARDMQAQRPKFPLGYALEGDILRAQKKIPAARAAYEAGIRKEVTDSGYLATKIHGAWLAEGNQAEAERYAQGWLKAHPKDATFPFHLGMVQMNAKDYAGAQTSFKTVIALQPTNARAWNNLAWASGELKQSAALEAINKALELSPEDPNYLDTKAHVMVRLGDLTNAIEVMKRAVEVSQQAIPMRLTLARMQIQAGNNSAAKELLVPLSSSVTAGPMRAEIERLLKDL